MQGTVPSYTPMRRTTPPCVAPQKAVIFSHSSQSDGTPLDSEPPTMLVVLTRSRSLNNGKVCSSFYTKRLITKCSDGINI